jgi:Domain of unknown function (DUF4338)
MPVNGEKLRSAIIRSLRKQGYGVRHGRVHMPDELTKDTYRKLHELAIKQKLLISKPTIQRLENRLINFIANGDEILPTQITPRLVLVTPKSEEELLFRYASLHWSIPVSPGYGRRLRFLVFDDFNGKLIGLFGLSDPVYAMHARDNWIGWDAKHQRKNLYHVMNAYVLGSVPPYSTLLCGKLIAMLVLSNEVRQAFRARYADSESIIDKIKRPPYLALVTTTSAFGRSSIYNRLRIDGFDYWKSIGFTQGTGEFHFSNGVYESIRKFAEENCEPTMKNAAWGEGFRNKREIIRKCLAEINLSQQMLNHGIQREIFAAPLGKNAIRFLKGEVTRPHFYDWSASQLIEKFRNRWLLSRAERTPSFREFTRESYRLWPDRVKR